MKTVTVILGLSILLFGHFLFAMATPPDLRRSISEFSTDLYGAVTDGTRSNIIISPFSVHLAVSLALMGTRGTTYWQMLRALKLNGTNAEISEEFHRLIEPMQQSSLLKVANKIYVMENYRTKRKFNRIAETKFQSKPKSLNFARAEESAATINKWVEDKTNNKIKNLISSGSLSTDTAMVLVNAIYFKGFWQHQFKKEDTRRAPFYINETSVSIVNMMRVKESFRHGVFNDLDAEAVELPYKDSDMSMLIILPNRRTGLAQLEDRLKNINMRNLSSQMNAEKVDLFLPKFKIEFKVSLVDALKKLGMKQMFTISADFSKLFEGTTPVQVSDVIHKAFIDVNEEGAEAAAATGVEFSNRIYVAPKQFLVNRPFVYAITSKSAGTIFMGRKMF